MEGREVTAKNDKMFCKNLKKAKTQQKETINHLGGDK